MNMNSSLNSIAGAGMTFQRDDVVPCPFVDQLNPNYWR